MSAPVRVLLVEDEALVRMMLEDMLTEMGHELAGQASQFEAAQDLARNLDYDLALLDINLGGTPSYPIADIVRERRKPLVFATGYGVTGLPPAYQSAVVVQKPIVEADLVRAITSALAEPTPSAT